MNIENKFMYKGVARDAVFRKLDFTKRDDKAIMTYLNDVLNLGITEQIFNAYIIDVGKENGVFISLPFISLIFNEKQYLTVVRVYDEFFFKKVTPDLQLLNDVISMLCDE